MFHCKCLTVNPIEENCFVISDETHEGIIIDCGILYPSEKQALQQYLKDEEIKLVKAIQTHMHFDHAFGLPWLKDIYGIGPWCHPDDLKTYEDNAAMCEQFFRARIPFKTVAIEGFLYDGDEVKFGNTTLKVIHTPGHTPGGISFYCESEGVVFCGDTLFQGSIGRTDFPGGNYQQEIESITNKLLKLPGDTIVYTGHGPQSSVEWELKNNPYLSL